MRGNRLDDLMRRENIAGVTALSRRVGLNHSTLSRIRAGHTKPTLMVIDAFRVAFPHISIDWIFPQQQQSKRGAA